MRNPSPLVDSHHTKHIKNPLDNSDLLIVQDRLYRCFDIDIGENKETCENGVIYQDKGIDIQTPSLTVIENSIH